MTDARARGPVATVAAKLQVKPGDVVAIAATPAEKALLGALPEGAEEGDRDGAAVVVTFVHDRDELLGRFASDLSRLGAARAVWYVYRKAKGADVNRDTIMREAGAFGWRAISNVAVDTEWSAVRVRPLADGEAPLG